MEATIDALYGVVLTEPEAEVLPDSPRPDDVTMETQLSEEIRSFAAAEPEVKAQQDPVPGQTVESAEGGSMPEPEPQSVPQPAAIQDEDAAAESRLSEEIVGLWTQHLELSGTRRATAKELRLIRNRLAERLYQIKVLLARPGRSGQWRSWLKQRGIVRSTADRLCQRYTESLGIEGEIASPAAIKDGGDTFEQLVQSLLPRLKRTLPDTLSVFRFIAAVAGAFNLISETTDDCIMVSQSKPEQSEPPAATGTPEAALVDVPSPGTDAPSSEPDSTVGAQV